MFCIGAKSSAMAILWYELLAEWRRRLLACRESLRDGGDRSAAAAMLRIRERILCFLLRRYEVRAGEPARKDAEAREGATDRVSFASYLAALPAPEVEPSDAFPPWRAREMSERIRDIGVQVQRSRRQRWAWWFW